MVCNATGSVFFVAATQYLSGIQSSLSVGRADAHSSQRSHRYWHKLVVLRLSPRVVCSVLDRRSLLVLWGMAAIAMELAGDSVSRVHDLRYRFESNIY